VAAEGREPGGRPQVAHAHRLVGWVLRVGDAAEFRVEEHQDVVVLEQQIGTVVPAAVVAVFGEGVVGVR
jgi:hypothetical protein